MEKLNEMIQELESVEVGESAMIVDIVRDYMPYLKELATKRLCSCP